MSVSFPYTVGLLIAAFFLGSLPTGYLLGRVHGIDLREHGSGNIGATNVKRTLGKKAGIYTLLVDALKGSAAVILGYLAVTLDGDDRVLQLVPFFGFAAIVGHCFSPFLKFHGGKGVATAVGVFFLLSPISVIFSLGIFATVVKGFGYISLGSILAAITLPIWIFIDISETYSTALFVAALCSALLITARHHSNIKRIVKGEERRIGL